MCSNACVISYNTKIILLQSLRRNIEAHLQQGAVYHAQIQAQHSRTMMQELEKIKSSLRNSSERLVAQAAHTESKMGSLTQDLSQEILQIKMRLEQLSAKIHVNSLPYATAVQAEAYPLHPFPALQEFEPLSTKVTESDRDVSYSMVLQFALAVMHIIVYRSQTWI